jgi:hypothetical protein
MRPVNSDGQQVKVCHCYRLNEPVGKQHLGQSVYLAAKLEAQYRPTATVNGSDHDLTPF